MEPEDLSRLSSDGNPVLHLRLNDGAPGAIQGDPDTSRSYDQSGPLALTYDPALNASQFSVESWAQFNGSCVINCFKTVLQSRDSGLGAGNVSGYQIGTHGTADGAGIIHFQIGDGNSWHGIFGDQVTPGAWYHIVGTYDGTTQRLFVNGQESGSATTPFTPSQGFPFRIGRGFTAGAFLTGGFVDEVAYYNYALSADRISAHYQTGIGVIPEPSTALLLGLGLAGMAARRRV